MDEHITKDLGKTTEFWLSLSNAAKGNLVSEALCFAENVKKCIVFSQKTSRSVFS